MLGRSLLPRHTISRSLSSAAQFEELGLDKNVSTYEFTHDRWLDLTTKLACPLHGSQHEKGIGTASSVTSERRKSPGQTRGAEILLAVLPLADALAARKCVTGEGK